MRSVQMALVIAAMGALAALTPHVALEHITDVLTEVTEAMEHVTELTARIETGMEESS